MITASVGLRVACPWSPHSRLGMITASVGLRVACPWSSPSRPGMITVSVGLRVACPWSSPSRLGMITASVGLRVACPWSPPSRLGMITLLNIFHYQTVFFILFTSLWYGRDNNRFKLNQHRSAMPRFQPTVIWSKTFVIEIKVRINQSKKTTF